MIKKSRVNLHLKFYVSFSCLLFIGIITVSYYVSLQFQKSCYHKTILLFLADVSSQGHLYRRLVGEVSRIGLPAEAKHLSFEEGQLVRPFLSLQFSDFLNLL